MSPASARDIRASALYRDAERAVADQTLPGQGVLVDAQEFDVAPNGRLAVFCGTVVDELAGLPVTCLCSVELSSGDVRVHRAGRGCDRYPRWSPDGRIVAFLSDRSGSPGHFQLHFFDPSSESVRCGPFVDGFVEYLEWARHGGRLLLGVAGAAADVAGSHGGTRVELESDRLPAWCPEIDTGPLDEHRRRLVDVNIATGHVAFVGPPELNVWSACWCGAETVVAIASGGPQESDWYGSSLYRIGLADGSIERLYHPRRQLGVVAASPSGRHVAVVEGLFSDRSMISGELVWVPAGEAPRRVPTAGVSVGHFSFADDDTIVFAGHRSLETVLGCVRPARDPARVLWASRARTFGTSRTPVVALTSGRALRSLALVEGFDRRPAICLLGEADSTRVIATLGSPVVAESVAALVAEVEAVEWRAPDGLEIHGWLLQPRAGVGPRPLVTEIHGGPVSQWRHQWLGSNALRRMLLERGYALLLPNPRGSAGRGQAFAERVLGDMAGADTNDYLSGVDSLVERRAADPRNLFVMGSSYGGFMSAWLITQDHRFAAAVPIAPVTNWVSEHLGCHIAKFCELFLDDDRRNLSGRYYSRSPVLHAGNARTPTLLIAGGLDRSTPPGQAVEFHHALLEAGCRSELVVYPGGGHIIRQYPAAIDCTARVVGWLEQHRTGLVGTDPERGRPAYSQPFVRVQLPMTA